MKRLIYRLYTFIRAHEESCEFFDDFGLMIQLTLGVVCISALLVKRAIEHPKRPWVIWFLDTLKQTIGQLSLHFTNIILAAKLGVKNGLECEWYLASLLCDTLFGVVVAWMYLSLILCLLKGTVCEYKTGDYGQGDGYSGETEEECSARAKKNWKFNMFLVQLLWWLAIVLIAKLTTSWVLVALGQIIEKMGRLILHPVRYNPKAKLILVMIIYPIIFNALQFWLVDSIIKKDEKISNTDNTLQQTIHE